MITVSRTTSFGLTAHVWTLVNSLWDGSRAEPVLEHAGLPRDRSGLGPLLWFLAGAVVAARTVVFMTPESSWLRQRFVRLLVGDMDRMTRQTGLDEPFMMASSAQKPNRDEVRLLRNPGLPRGASPRNFAPAWGATANAEPHAALARAR